MSHIKNIREIKKSRHIHCPYCKNNKRDGYLKCLKETERQWHDGDIADQDVFLEIEEAIKEAEDV